VWAWRVTPTPGKGQVELEEPYNCERDCQDSTGVWDDAFRSARGCKRLGVKAVRFAPQANALYQVKPGNPYMGRYPDKKLAGQRVLDIPLNWSVPLEDPSLGCPGAWYRTPWIDSLDKYLRRRTQDGGRIPNPRFDRADWQIQEAVMVFEQEQDRAIASFVKEQHERNRKRIEADQKQQANGPRGHG